MLTLTESAVKKVREFYAGDSSLQGKALRVFVEKGGCSSFQYGFAFDEKKEGDIEVPVDGLQVVVDSQSSSMLSGSTIDYKEDFSGSGFAISNPNAKQSCGCGKSFEA
ncbi:MAG: HesB/IscA family protein [Elusimicrobiota bacterium]|jgi:iron-sulfur cluster assembly accessory protein